MKKRLLSVLFVLTMLFSLALVTGITASAEGEWYTGGDGSAATPYIISTYDGLNAFAEYVNAGNDMDGDYIKLADGFGRGEGTAEALTTPIGLNWDYYFVGTFDGNNQNVVLNISGFEYAGMFGVVDDDGTLKNVSVSGTVSGTYCVGGLAGEIGGKIINCSSSCNVTFSGTVDYDIYIGGLVGDGWGIMTNSYATGVVDCSGTTSEYIYIGGLAGFYGGTITNSYATGNVACSEETKGKYIYVGGLVGYNNGLIINSYAKGNVTCDGTATDGFFVGGLVGENYTTITNSYATGDVYCSGTTTASDGVIYVGGLAGENDDTITNSYATGNVTCGEEAKGENICIGGLVGFIDEGTIANSYAKGNVTCNVTTDGEKCVGRLIGYTNADAFNCYYQIIESSTIPGIGVVEEPDEGEESHDVTTCYALPVSQMTAAAGATDETWVEITVDGDNIGKVSLVDALNICRSTGLIGSAKSWKVDSEENGGYPYHIIIPVDTSWYDDAAAGVGSTEDNPYLIHNIAQLEGLASLVNAGNDMEGKYIKLADDFACGEGEALTTPIGPDYDCYFSGTFDGNNKDVVLDILGYEYAGMFCVNYGTVKNVSTSGKVIGTCCVGGLVEDNYGEIINCSSSCEVSCGAINMDYQDIYIGGLVGYNEGSITNSYATGDVDCSGTASNGEIYVGGLIGENYGTITNSYANGDVTCSGTASDGEIYVGGLVGCNYWRSTIINSYATGNVTCGEEAKGKRIYVGGLVGFNYRTITNCYYETGNVTCSGTATNGDIYVGGLIGINYGTVTNNYAKGDVVCGEDAEGKNIYVGGLVGYNGTDDIINNYETGNVTCNGTATDGEKYVGRLFGYVDDDATNCYYQEIESSTVPGIGNEVDEDSYAATTCFALSEAQMTAAAGATDENWIEITVGYGNIGKVSLVDALNDYVRALSGAKPWKVDSEKNDGYPILGDVAYIDADGSTKYCTEYTVVTESDDAVIWSDGWYVVNGWHDVINGGVTVSGDVKLILCDGADLTVNGESGKAGITVSGENNRLTIYGQTNGSGEIIAKAGSGGAGIGGNAADDEDNGNGSNITINGGTVTATGNGGGAGIGGGDADTENTGNGSNITITGGTVTATGISGGAGIGGGCADDGKNSGNGRDITINGGTVTAIGDSGGAGIGGGCAYYGENTGNGRDITITGGTVTATGDGGGAGIGGGCAYGENTGNGSYITINGGTVNATGNNGGAGIGGGCAYEYENTGNGSYITISGGRVTATGDGGGAGIGGGYAVGENTGNGSDITISGGIVTATGDEGGAGIGGGYADAENTGNGSNITISGGTVTATGYEGGAGIGGGCAYGENTGNGSNITINGGIVNAIGYCGGAGIGGGCSYGEEQNGCASNITVNGGFVYAIGGDAEYKAGAGIGCGGANSEGDYTGTVSGIYVNKDLRITAGDSVPLTEEVCDSRESDTDIASDLTRQYVRISKSWYTSGDGTEEAPYIIKNYDELNAFACYVSIGGNMENEFIKLADDFGKGEGTAEALTTPIGCCEDESEWYYFSGTFDGNNKDVVLDISDFKYAGMFGVTYGTVKNVSVSGTVSGTCSLGGLAGENDGEIINCSSSCTVSFSKNLSGDIDIGGLVGDNIGTITNCYATGDVSFSGTVTDSDGIIDIYVGGLVCWNNGTITNSYATGDVSFGGTVITKEFLDIYVGGLAAGNGGNITNSYATGDVDCSGTTNYGNNYIGGLVGFNSYGDCHITNCHATGDVSFSATKPEGGIHVDICVGGLVGSNNYEDSYITNCYATGNVSFSGTIVDDSHQIKIIVGGLVGDNYGFITNSYATGSISFTGSSANNYPIYVGGLVGENYYGTITNNYVTGDVSFSGKAIGDINFGGLVGYYYKGTITNNYVTGDVTCSGTADDEKYVGRLFGYVDADAFNCYYPEDEESTVPGIGNGEDISYDVTTCYALSEAQMKAAAGATDENWVEITVGEDIIGKVSLVDALNTYVEADSNANGYLYWIVMNENVNGGYPMFALDNPIYLKGGKAYNDAACEPESEIPMPDGITYENGTYTFNNVNIPSNEDNCLYIADNKATVKLEGTNQLGTKADVELSDYTSDYGIFAENCDLTVTGSGSLTTYSVKAGIKAKYITFDINFTGTYTSYDVGGEPGCCLEATKVIIRNGTFYLNNIRTKGIYAEDIEISGGEIYVKGGDAAVEATNSLTLSVMDVIDANEEYVAGTTKKLTNKADTEYVKIEKGEIPCTCEMSLCVGTDLTLIIGGKEYGKVDISYENGWIIYDTTKKQYVGFNDSTKQLKYSESEYKWNYDGTGLYREITTTVRTKILFFYRKTTTTERFYLTADGINKTPNKGVKVVKVFEKHNYKATNKDKTNHTCTCTQCGNTYDEEHIFKDNVCICGAKEKSEGRFKGIEVSIETKVVSRKLADIIKGKNKAHTVKITPYGDEGVYATDIQYSLNGQSMVKGDSFVTYSSEFEIDVQITDNNGNITNWHYSTKDQKPVRK